MGRFSVRTKLDFADVPIAVWNYGQVNDTKVVVSSGDYKVILRGDFTEGASGNLRGTLNKFIYEIDGVEQFRGENLNLNAFNYFNALEGANLRPLDVWNEVVSRKDKFYGGGDADDMFLGGNLDTAWGKGGNDTIDGAGGDDLLYGGGGIDFLYGGANLDTAYGGAGSDNLFGGDGSDSLYGGNANDYLYGGAGLDSVYGGGGVDNLYGGNGSGRLYGGGAADFIFGGDKGDRLYGGDSDDFLYAGGGADTQFGGAGKDAFYGGLGTDTFYGGAGNDYFAPNAGKTIITGGRGADDFQFDTFSGNRTVIKDFGKGNDLLVFAKVLFGQDLTAEQIYEEYGSKENGHTLFEIGELKIQLNDYTTNSTGWGDNILTY